MILPKLLILLTVESSILKASSNHYDQDGPEIYVEWRLNINFVRIHTRTSLLQKEQAASEVKMIQILAVGKQPPRKENYRFLDSLIGTPKESLPNGL